MPGGLHSGQLAFNNVLLRAFLCPRKLSEQSPPLLSAMRNNLSWCDALGATSRARH